MAQHGITSAALPAMSTGAYRFPLDRATRIAVRQTRSYLERHPGLRLVVFCCCERPAYDAYVATGAETFG
jgi:O-acetyl-ADP-ribose deacetylase (regulator of RNase III)